MEVNKMYRMKFFVLIFALLFVGTSCSKEQGSEAASLAGTKKSVKKAGKTALSKDYLSLMPEKTNFLFYANFESLRESAIGNDLKSEFEKKLHENKENQEYWDFIEKTGLDPQKDIYEIWVGGYAEGEHDHAGGAVVRGKFDDKRIIKYLEEDEDHDVHQLNYRNHTIYSVKDRRHHDDENEFAFLNSQTAVVGKPSWIRLIIDNFEDGGTNVFDNASMRDFMEQIPHKDQLWGVLNIHELTGEWAERIRKQGSTFKGTQSLENMQSLVFYTKIAQKATVFVKGNFTTEEEAELLAEMLNGFKALAKLMVSDDKDAVDMLNDIKIKTDGPVLSITSKVDRSFFDKLQEKREKFSDGRVKLL